MSFSCIIPVKGARPFFKEALASIEKQGIDVEVIIQDGDKETDSGQSDALNRGFAKAHGEWLFWLNADDVLLPGALKSVAQYIFNAEKQRGREAEWIVGNQLFIDESGKVLKTSVGNGWHNFLYKHAVPHVYGPSAFFKRSLFERVGGFDTSLHYCMDWDLWIKFMKTGARFLRIPEYIWGQRQWDGSKTQRSKSRDEAAVHWAEIDRMLRKNGLHVTRGGDALMRLWRLFNGNILKQWMDTLRSRGRNYSEIFG